MAFSLPLHPLTLMLKKEDMNKLYEKLYVEHPYKQLAPAEQMQASVRALEADSETGLFRQHSAAVVQAALTTKDFVCSNEFHKTLLELYKAKSKKNLDIYNLLSAVSLTNSVLKIDFEYRPREVFGTIKLEDADEAVAFLRYLNNYLIEVLGMRDLRENAKAYTDFITKTLSADNAEVRLNGWRCALAAARALTHVQIQQEFVDTLVDGWQQLSLRQQEKPDVNVFNVACTAVGRLCLTLLDESAARGNQLKMKLKGMGVQLSAEAPSVTALKAFLGAAKVKKEEDEMF